MGLKYGTRFQGELKRWQRDAFRASFSNPSLDDWLVTFAATAGRITSLRVQESPWAPSWYDDRDDLGVFERR